MITDEEQHLLDKLASGELDGRIGEEQRYRIYSNIYCGKLIRKGIPVTYRQKHPSTGDDLAEDGHEQMEREEQTFTTKEEKLSFLQRFGWLMDDEEIRTYSSRFKPERKK